MTNFIECMVERKRTAKDFALAALGIAVGFVVVMFLMTLPIYSMLTTLLVVGVIYVLYRFISRINTEYEYIITNNEMDIDRIINRRSRKRLGSVHLKRIEEFEMCDGREKRYLDDNGYRKIIACRDRGEGCAYITYHSDEGKGILLFTPDEKITEYINKAIAGRF